MLPRDLIVLVVQLRHCIEAPLPAEAQIRVPGPSYRAITVPQIDPGLVKRGGAVGRQVSLAEHGYA